MSDAGAPGGAPGGDRGAQDVTDGGPFSAGFSDGPGPAGSSAPEGDYPDITTEADDLEEDLAEDLVEMVDIAKKIEQERDEYLDLARRVQAEFENYKRRVDQQRVEQRERAAEDLVTELLPVLDAGEAALAQGQEDVAPLHAQLVAALEKRGLTPVVDAEVDFDPNVHEAVMHEEGDSDTPVVAEVLRTGYLWNQRVLRPAMVKVRG